jgi:D-amino-acid dehydrogenase
VSAGRAGRPPERVAVIGAGVAGLSTAWFLQERGAGVTVYDRGEVGAGSSRGNAGWIVPGLVEPLPGPAAARSAIGALLRASGAVRITLGPHRTPWRFLTASARQCTSARWHGSMRAFAAVTPSARAAFEALGEAGVDITVAEASPLLACFRTPGQRDAMAHELARMRDAGQPVEFDVLTGDDARSIEPCLAAPVTAAIAVHGQQYVDPLAFVTELAASVRTRGADLCFGAEVLDVTDHGSHVLVTTAERAAPYDAAVLASGAWLGRLGRPFGVRLPVQAGRGYSFSVAVQPAPTHPLYFPRQRVACTPMDGRLRVAGMMEFTDADDPFRDRRSRALGRTAAALLDGADWAGRRQEWVGARPCTADGLPLVGATSSRRVFVCGGHGMWGMVLGPVSGQLLAGLMSTGEAPSLAAFDPRRRTKAAA